MYATESRDEIKFWQQTVWNFALWHSCRRSRVAMNLSQRVDSFIMHKGDFLLKKRASWVLYVVARWTCGAVFASGNLLLRRKTKARMHGQTGQSLVCNNRGTEGQVRELGKEKERERENIHNSNFHIIINFSLSQRAALIICPRPTLGYSYISN